MGHFGRTSGAHQILRLQGRRSGQFAGEAQAVLRRKAKLFRKAGIRACSCPAALPQEGHIRRASPFLAWHQARNSFSAGTMKSK